MVVEQMKVQRGATCVLLLLLLMVVEQVKVQRGAPCVLLLLFLMVLELVESSVSQYTKSLFSRARVGSSYILEFEQRT